MLGMPKIRSAKATCGDAFRMPPLLPPWLDVRNDINS